MRLAPLPGTHGTLASLARIGLVITLWGCGAGQSGAGEPASDDACEVARLDAQRAWRSLAREAEAVAPPPTGPALRLEAVLERLEAHVAALRAEPREVEGEEAFALADAMMDGLDEVSSAISDSLHRRADDAAEAVLTDRSAEGSVRATSDAIAVLTDVIGEARPDRAAARTQRYHVDELGRRAADAAESYGRGVQPGDRDASRAEELPLPDDVLGPERTRAIDASREARERCGVARTLSVPSPS